MKASDFTKLDHGPYGIRWSFEYDPAQDCPPTVRVAAEVLGVKLAPESFDASSEHDDGLAEEIYFSAEEGCDPNTLATYSVQ